LVPFAVGAGGHIWDISVRDINEPSINFWKGSANAMIVVYFGTVTATAFNPTRDRNAKENLAPTDPREILAKVAALPLTRWNFKQEPGVTHLGPVSQDFQAAFGLGTDDKRIATVDADGVALAAIQGLQQELQAKDAQIRELQHDLAELKALVRQLNAK
jgi:hypothetical protein